MLQRVSRVSFTTIFKTLQNKLISVYKNENYFHSFQINTRIDSINENYINQIDSIIAKLKLGYE